MFKQKSVWAQLGMGGKGRDANVPSAPAPVSEDAQAKNTKSTAKLVEFVPQNRSLDQLPQRPSTSAGPASSFTKRKNAEKRQTKDDLHFHFNPITADGEGTTFLTFPSQEHFQHLPPHPCRPPLHLETRLWLAPRRRIPWK